jgi:hypothetical protein
MAALGGSRVYIRHFLLLDGMMLGKEGRRRSKIF